MSIVLRHARLAHNALQPSTVIGSWTTTQLAQSTTVRTTAGALYYVNWGDGTVETKTGNGADQANAHTYGSAGTYRQTWSIADATKLSWITTANNALMGGIPPIKKFSALSLVNITQGNLFVGEIPDLPNSVNYVYFRNCVGVGGTIPTLTSKLLTEVKCNDCSLTGYTPSVLNANITTFLLHNNLLTLAALKLIIADFLVSASGPGRPAVVTI